MTFTTQELIDEADRALLIVGDQIATHMKSYDEELRAWNARAGTDAPAQARLDEIAERNRVLRAAQEDAEAALVRHRDGSGMLAGLSPSHRARTSELTAAVEEAARARAEHRTTTADERAELAAAVQRGKVGPKPPPLPAELAESLEYWQARLQALTDGVALGPALPPHPLPAVKPQLAHGLTAEQSLQPSPAPQL
jgi:hypothetical protein